MNVPSKQAAYFQLLDKLLTRKDKTGAMKVCSHVKAAPCVLSCVTQVLEAMDKAGIKLTKTTSKKIVMAFSAV